MVTFPGLGLTFEVSKIAGNIFGIHIYNYALCIICGIILALILCAFDKNNFGIKFDFVFETLIYAIIIGLIGARIYYVLFNLHFYIISPLKILNIRDGGLAIYGGLISGAIFVIKRCKKYKVDRLDFFDYLVPFVAIAQSVGRWGNFFNREAYGIETANVFRMGIDENGIYKEVHPAFLYESIGTLLIFMILIILQNRRKFKGEICYLYLVLYSGIRMVIEGVRIDSLMIKNFRISQILSVAIFVVFGSMLLKKYKKYRYKRVKCRKC